MVGQASSGNSGPEPAELAARVGDLSRHAQDQLAKQICLDDPEDMQCLQSKVEQLRAEMSGPVDPPAVRLLTERVVTDWLYCYFLDLICGRVENSSGSVSPALIR